MDWPPQTFLPGFVIHPSVQVSVILSISILEFFDIQIFGESGWPWNPMWPKVTPRGPKIGFFEKSRKVGGCVGIGSKRSKMDINNIPDHSPVNFRIFSQKILFLGFFGVSRAQIPSKKPKNRFLTPKIGKKIDFWAGKHQKPLICP